MSDPVFFLLQSPVQDASRRAFDDVAVATIVELDIDHPEHADGNTSGQDEPHPEILVRAPN